MPALLKISPVFVTRPFTLAASGFILMATLAACATPPDPKAEPAPPPVAAKPALPVLAETALKRFVIDETQVSVSGVSSGGSMASQLHIAYSSVFKKGAGLFATAPYYCAQASMMTALGPCLNMNETENANVPKLVEQTKAWSGGLIDPVSNLSASKVYIFSGAFDTMVKTIAVNETDKFYRNFVPGENIFYKKDLKAAHSMVTLSYGNPCDGFATPFLNSCGFDLAGETLKWIHGPLNPRTAAVQGNLMQFDQNEFRAPESRDIDGFDSNAWVYVPSACKAGATCKLHVALHGCTQGQAFVGDQYVRNAGYNEWAEANNMIVLYPQAVVSGVVGTPAFNPIGCWDWWGYTGPEYAHKVGVQPFAIKKMVDRLKGRI
ncbi:PHB depolymerase family esterase [soil metagenome]